MMETITQPNLLIDEATAVKALAALAQAQRLRTFRALVVAGPAGLTPGAIGAMLGVTPSALSFHLKELAHSGLVSSEPRGRNLIYRAKFDHMLELMNYMTKHCCQGQTCEVTDTASCEACSEGS